MTTRETPFDGKPCPMCPMEIRNLHATAHNYINAVKGGDSPERVARKFAGLVDAVEKAQPLADAHFADRLHSHGQVY